MKYFGFMHSGNSLQQIANDEGGTLFAQFGATGHDIIKLPVASQLQNGVEILLICKEAVGFDDVGVVKESLNLQFSDELGQKVIFYYFLFVHHFQGDDHACVLLACQTYSTKFTLAQIANYFEILSAETFGSKLGFVWRFCLVSKKRWQHFFRFVGHELFGGNGGSTLFDIESLVGSSSGVPCFEENLVFFMFLRSSFFYIPHLLPINWSFLTLLLSRAQGIVRPGVEPPKFLIGGVSGKHLLLLLPLIEFVKFELGGGLLGDLRVVGGGMRVHDETASGTRGLVVVPGEVGSQIFVHGNKLSKYIISHYQPSGIMEPTLKSFAIPNQLTSSNKKQNQPSTPGKPISHIFAQTTIKESNLEYQQLLIQNKELELKMVELQVHLSHLQKQRKKADREKEEVEHRKEIAQIQLREKQHYLQKYYNELDRKFRGGREDLFSGLKKLQQNLLQMYQRDQKRIKESLQPEREECKRIQSLIEIQRSQRDNLVQQLTAIERMRNINSIPHPANERQELQTENLYIKNQIQRLTKEKKNLENQEKILKKILNIEEEHKKHGAVIAAGIRKMFAIKVKQQKYKEAVAQDYAKNLTGLRDIIGKRRTEKQALFKEYQQKKGKLTKMKEQNGSKNKQYSELQDQLFRYEPK